MLRCSPVGMCSCRSDATRGAAITPSEASRASAGQTRRWTKVTLPSISLKQRTSSESSSSDSASKIALPLGCAHQLPMIGWPATASATLGTGPRADARTTPWRSTKRSQRLAGARLAAGRFVAARFAGLAEARLTGLAAARLATGRFAGLAAMRFARLAGLLAARRGDDDVLARLAEVDVRVTASPGDDEEEITGRDEAIAIFGHADDLLAVLAE